MSSVVIDLTDLLPTDSPELASCEWISRAFHVPTVTVYRAVHDGRLPSYPRPSVRGDAFGIRPADAALIWGYRLRCATESTTT